MTAADGDANPGEGRRRERLVPEISAGLQATAEQQHRASLVVADHAADPEDARELLDMLGLPDPRPEVAP